MPPSCVQLDYIVAIIHEHLQKQTEQRVNVKNRHRKITTTLIQTIHPNRIAVNTCEQETRSAEARALTTVIEKSATDPQTNLRCKKNLNEIHEHLIYL